MRSLKFASRAHNRYWWYRLHDAQYVPLIFRGLTDSEWSLMDEWFTDTEAKFPSPGEISIPGISMLAGLISGNGLSAIVQCGHYVGYSTLLLGFLLRSMGKFNSLFSIDIDPVSTEYTASWIEKAQLDVYVRLHLGTSADPSLPARATEYFGLPPQLVFIDSSHQYSHTLGELDLWYEALLPGGFMMMHDVSSFAQSFDTTKQGGVLRATTEWAGRRALQLFLINSFVDGRQSTDELTYRDGCGLGLLQKPL
jgi:predicted O-methyltransferase YrrM